MQKSMKAGPVIQAAVAFYVVVAALMHILQPEMSPVAMPMSAYVLGLGGFLMTMTFFALSLALFATWWGLKHHLGRDWKSRIGSFFILLAAVATSVAGFFPDDGLQPPLLPVTTTGWVHMAAGMFAFPSFLFGPLFLSLAIRDRAEWRGRMPAVLTVVVLLAVAAVCFITIAAPNDMAGLAQRVLLILVLAWLLLIASGLNAARQIPTPSSVA